MKLTDIDLLQNTAFWNQLEDLLKTIQSVDKVIQMSESSWSQLRQIVLHWEEIERQLKVIAVERSHNCFAGSIQTYLNAASEDWGWTKCVSKQVLLFYLTAYYLHSANADCEMQLNRGYTMNQFFVKHLSLKHKNTVMRQFWEFWMRQKKFAGHNYVWQ